MSRPRGHRDLVAAMAKHVEATPSAAPVRAAVEDGGTDLAIARANAAVAAGRPLRPAERREVRREVLGKQAGHSSPGRRPRLRDRLEAMDDAARESAIASVTPGTRERHYIESLVESIRQDEDEAELRVALQDERQALRNIDDDGSWSGEGDQGEAIEWPAWDDGLTEAERAAAVDVAAATAGPLYRGEPSELDVDDDDFGGEVDE